MERTAQMSTALVTKPSQNALVLQQEPSTDGISKQQKAAILLSVLMGADATPNLDHIGTDSLKNTVDIMASFGEVDRPTVDLIILEFLSELQEFGISMRAGLEDTLTALKGHVSDKSLEKIRKAYVRSPAVDVWTRVASADVLQLRKCLAKEHIQISATVLSKLPSTQAAEILGTLDPNDARAVMLAIINAQEVRPEVLALIGQSISDTLFSNDGPSVFEKTPVERAGDIMNFAQSEIRERLMEEFGKSDPATAEKIRKVMFTFPDIPVRVLPKDISAVTRTVSPEVLLVALKGGESSAPEVVEFVLASLSSRIADQMKEELAETTTPKKKDAEAAMNEIIIGIRQLESDGAIVLIVEEEGEE